MKRTALEWKAYYSTLEFQKNYEYQGNDLGVTCTEEGTSFLLWSPSAKEVQLNLYKNGSDAPCFQKVQMQKELYGIWKYKTSECLHGIYYDYDVTIEDITERSADPYAKACGINGKRSMAVNLEKTNPEGWEEDHAPIQQEERIIYELHVKEFSWHEAGGFPKEYRGKYKAFSYVNTTLNKDGIHVTGIPYLKELGITHIQLMPVYDYGSVDEAGDETKEFNWGYDPINYNVPEGSYSTDAEHGEVRIYELKEMIQSLHKQGFRVIMDVVYNHTYALDSCFQKTAPWYFYRLHENGDISNGSACGNDMASERFMCAKYILNSVLYWAEEYHIDGFRFDLMGLLDTELMNQIRTELDIRYGKGEKLVFGEPWAADVTAIERNSVQALKKNSHLLDENIGMFCDNTRDAIKGSVFEKEEAGFVNGANRLEDKILNSIKAWCNTKNKKEISVKAPSQIITYVSAHDNQTLWDKIASTVTKESDRMRVNKMAAAVYMTCQGTLFFLSGEEFARTKKGLDNTYNASIELNCLDWKRAWHNRELVEYYKGLIALRKQLPGLCDKSQDAEKRIHPVWKKRGALAILVDNTKENSSTVWKTLFLLYNSREKEIEVELPEGEWEILADEDDSFSWKHPVKISGKAKVASVSVLLLGLRENEK